MKEAGSLMRTTKTQERKVSRNFVISYVGLDLNRSPDERLSRAETSFVPEVFAWWNQSFQDQNLDFVIP